MIVLNVQAKFLSRSLEIICALVYLAREMARGSGIPEFSFLVHLLCKSSQIHTHTLLSLSFFFLFGTYVPIAH